MSNRIGDFAFISYRSSAHKAAAHAQRTLINEGYCGRVVYAKPATFCEEGELFLPYEYFEIMGATHDYLHACDVFLYLDTHAYRDSYFTQAELLQWRRFRDRPVVHRLTVDRRGGITVGRAEALLPMSYNDKRLWAGLSVQIERRYRGRFNPGFRGGRLHKSHFIVPC
ncbi:MAG: hypothetical protein AAGD38_22655, partial [Acidobacteriota bacterium]